MTREYGNKSETEISTTDQVYHAARGVAYIQDYYNLNITEFSQGTFSSPIIEKHQLVYNNKYLSNFFKKVS